MSTETVLNLNKNPLTSGNFRFGFKRTPNTNYFIQSVNLPGITFGSVEQPSMRKKLPLIGNASLNYDNFIMSFIVDEELNNYIEIYDWLKANAAPENFEQHIPESIMSDGSLIANNSNHKGVAEFLMEDMFPVNLSGLQFETTNPDKTNITAIAEFRFLGYTINRL